METPLLAPRNPSNDTPATSVTFNESRRVADPYPARPVQSEYVGPMERPKTPEEAVEQSTILREAIQIEDERLREREFGRLAELRFRAPDILPLAETRLLFVQNLQNGLHEIQNEEDEQVRRALWDDLLGFQSHYDTAYYNANNVTHALSAANEFGKRFYPRERAIATQHFKQSVVTPGRLLSTYDELTATGDMMDELLASKGDSDTPDPRAVYMKLTNASSAYKSADDVPPEAWDNLSRSVRIINELDRYDGQSPISLELSNRLSAYLDLYLKIVDEQVEWSHDRVEEIKKIGPMTDEELGKYIDEKFPYEENSNHERAKELVKKDLNLFRKIAGEMAVEAGVKLRRR